MRRIAAVILLLCLLAGTAGGIQIVEFCPDPYQPGDPDEYLVLEGTGILDGYVLSDGEGGYRFPPGTRIDGRLTVARSGPAFEQSHGYLPDFEIEERTPAVPDVIPNGNLLMANRADELLLYRGTTLVQQIAWPGDVCAREGQIHYFEDGAWDPRPLSIGQSRLKPQTFEGVAVTAFVAPDCSYEIFSAAVAEAEREILVNVYEFTDEKMANDLICALDRGVAVTVLLEGGPVGGVSPEGRAVAGALNRSGIPVLSMTTTDAGHAKYRYDHAKYLVIDGSTVLLGSENFKPGGYPAAGLQGNRGWGVLLKDPELTAYFREVFLFDAAGGDIVPLGGTAAELYTPWAPDYTVEFAPCHAEGARVTPVVSPDTSVLILGLIEGAEESIAIEQAYITNETPCDFNPYLAAAIDASRRGVAVRVLLDAAWFNTEGDADNDEMAAIINRLAAAEGLPLEARLADLEANNLDKIHNKGVIVDGTKVLVSSINWNANSPAFNREAGVIVEHPDIAVYYLAVFEDDWDASDRSKASSAPETDRLKIAAAACILAALAGLYLYRRRRT
ncbi:MULTISPECIES: phospholipase D-like domain-containing protein [Methanoculleus]|uniref:Phospholipase D/Transphosphatidylase n=2 Tax=Methanoculleus TaxID=45989 RepID=A3CYB9_METMJ|nr:MULTISPECIES: phospholipase D-like domain-containing protein [Methanoculleus]ABN58369.1 phospholipase D/Transphosphatidylase [Methanoculleus marisnigri JR1]MCC7554610.1 phospholipase [Methanoculleus marisnigri]UYU17369.1 phospholipase D-like domain-containing protein [Methanoculleus submarinus]